MHATVDFPRVTLITSLTPARYFWFGSDRREKAGSRDGREEGKEMGEAFPSPEPSPVAAGLTAVELLSRQGDDGAAVQLPRSLAGCGCLNAALLRVFLQQLGQPQQIAVAEQGVGIQPPARARGKHFSPQPPACVPTCCLSPGHERGAALDWRTTRLFFLAFDYIPNENQKCLIPIALKFLTKSEWFCWNTVVYRSS